MAWVTDKGLVGGTKDGSGLTHLGARELDPTTGRFISVDPVFNGDDPQQMQGYNYAGANPVTMSDADGRMYKNTVDSMGPIRTPSKKALEQAKHTKPYSDPRWDSHGRPRHQSVYQHYIPPRPTPWWSPVHWSSVDPGILSLGIHGYAPKEPRSNCQSYNSGWSSPAACGDGYDAADRLNKQAHDEYQHKLDLQPKCASYVFGIICNKPDPPDLPTYTDPMHAVQKEYDLLHPKAPKEHGRSQWFISVGFCFVLCVSLTTTEDGGVWIGASGLSTPGASLVVGKNAEPMDDMKDWGAQQCAGLFAGYCGQVGVDAKTGKPVAGGGLLLSNGPALSGGPTWTYRLPPPS